MLILVLVNIVCVCVAYINFFLPRKLFEYLEARLFLARLPHSNSAALPFKISKILTPVSIKLRSPVIREGGVIGLKITLVPIVL